MSTTGTSRGFTLIELLIVLLIVGIMTSLAAISLKVARPSTTKILFNQMKNQFRSAINFSQFRNVDLRIKFIEKKEDKASYYQTEIRQLTPKDGKWIENKSIAEKALTWKNNTVSMDVENIMIAPDGTITPATISFKLDDESYQFETKKLMQNNKNPKENP
ncbi:MAG: prepilin-type N-terminal cleavage/methylation domain-containing protein [Gammaproteobacteria bacterium]|nr:prepilin-type N-terminal cleavage/methylation domain-containing protein [Gammaproteobacteria bacterium]